MTVTIDFYYDLASPNAYLANQVLVPMASRYEATINYLPVLLGGVFKATKNQAPWITFAPVKEKMAYGQIEMQRFIDKHGLTRFSFNPHFPLNTLLLARGAVAAQAAGQLEAYIRAGEALVWEAGLKMDDPAVFEQGFNSHGLDGAALLAQTQSPDVKARLIANTDKAVQRGVFGLPTFFVADEIFFGKETLRDIEDLLGACSDSSGADYR
jgi:2-hydroxychromene-2-carboxylate isomerase